MSNATIEQYYFGQGRLWSRPYGSSNPADWRWWGDISQLDVAGETENIEHKESYSGQRNKVRSISLGSSMTITGTLHQVDTLALAELLYGAASEIASAAITGEPLGTVEVGDMIRLDNPGVSSLEITDSAVTPVTLAPEHYVLDADFGVIEIVSLPATAPTWPLKASYQAAGGKQVNFFTQPQPNLELKYEGVNLAENMAPVQVHFYKVATQPLQGLALIQNGNELAGNQFTLDVLSDTAKPMSGPLGRMGRFIQVARAAP
ncbi:MAG: hypothetical protein LBQ81_12180 [Zoogloeaceae bacterium]|jgi:hypothetical protein|nr:hypothetical protein [Zoogloeaceae bacterium]